jgi:tetratricopeptide (TPR) repeat protein
VLAGEQAAVRGMILLSAGRDDKAIEAFGLAQRLPLASPDLVAAMRAQLMASRGDASGARKTIGMSVEENGPGSATDQVLVQLASGQPVASPKLSLRESAALAIHLASAGGIARSSPELAALRYSLALHLDPDLEPARLLFADALSEQDRAEEALVVLAGIPAASPWNAEARLKEAWLLDDLGRAGEALAAADKAIEGSHRRDIVIGVADLNRVSRNHVRAARLYDEVVASDIAAGRQDWRVLFARATARKGNGDWKGAEADLIAALAIEPDRPELQNFLGYGWVDRGERVEEGMDLIRKAVAARPDQGFIVDSLGWAHFRLGHYEEAVGYLERAAELSPGEAEIADHLGDAYWRTGREGEARFEWSGALGLDPDPLRETALREKLDKGLPAVPSANLASRP